MGDISEKWIPLEANPEVLDAFLRRLGVRDDWSFQDVYGLDSELLAMVPRPVSAVLMVYPITPKSETDILGKYDKQVTDLRGGDMYFMKQTISNACGTVALVHTVANNMKMLGVDAECSFAKFVKNSRTLEPVERCKFLGKDKTITEAHSDLSHQGQSDIPPPEDNINLHFVAFIHHNGKLYEMDGRKEAPVDHGFASDDTLLESSIDVVKKFIERDPGLITFTLTALSKV